jgi:hypothetical protein
VLASDNAARLRSDAAFAALCGVSPIEASSGKTRRHRLNKGGDRQGNNALWTIANNRLIHHPETRAYAARRTAQGLTRREIVRCIKRHLARRLYRLVVADLTATTAPDLTSEHRSALVEAFWSRMQVELLDIRRWRTRVELANATFEYIEIFHNRRRRHSALGMRTPIEYELINNNTNTSAAA